ncbi:LysR substrate-binding domain-containing protein [Sulfitobacter sp. F26204]|uniref:LysR family transcriptional regulator n=1 Tax=Sulfitobacter sp. F26204 TaxID=2996014 RepID=UPI00225E6822|nr:LysR substrate-binding domain-containing protein [Sulfitobacter sp. F26204]MCX7559253.1 LysR substrate-binding domain-containing protein [Sulfitobacter sp. F26204]
MNDRHLSCFAAIYDEGSMTGAAERLRLPISSLSLHLNNLEAQLGVTLFRRHRRGMEPTAAGERFYGHVRGILTAMTNARQDMQAATNRVTGSVTLVMAGSANRAIGFKLVERVSQEYPDLRLTLTESLSGAALDELHHGRADLAVAFNPTPGPGIRITPVLDEDLVLVGQSRIIGESVEPIAFEDILRLPLILLQQGLSARALTRDTRLLKRIEASARLQVNSITTISESLCAGLGATIGTRLIFAGEIATGALNARPIMRPALDRTLCVIESTARAQTFALEHMQAMIISLLEESVREKRWEARLVA